MKAIYMPRVIEAKYLHDYCIHIIFSNGKEGIVDLSNREAGVRSLQQWQALVGR